MDSLRLYHLDARFGSKFPFIEKKCVIPSSPCVDNVTDIMRIKLPQIYSYV